MELYTRRNIGFLLASRIGADIVATVDDDNIPLKNWEKNILINKYVDTNIYSDKLRFFDPISVTEHKDLWQGIPIQLLDKRNPKNK